MEPVEFTPSFRKSIDLLLLCELSEASIRERVLATPIQELRGSRSALINRLHIELLIRMPQIDWNGAELVERLLDDDGWELRLVAPMCDPSWVAWSIVWPSDDEDATYEPDSEQNRLVITQRLWGCTAEVRSEFEHSIQQFQVTYEQAAKEVERFNAAIPYLLSRWTEARLDGSSLVTDIKSAETAPLPSKGISRMLEKMVAMSLVISALLPTSMVAGAVQQTWPSSVIALVKHCFPST